MNLIKLFIASLTIFSTCAYAISKDLKTPEICAKINKCVGSNCSVTSPISIALEKKCIQEQTDISSVKSSKDISELFLKSDLGYLLAFSSVILSQKSPSQYDSIKKDFTVISQKYDQYLKTDVKKYLEQFKNEKSYYENEINSHSKNQILIDRNIKILNFMLESEQKFSLYQQTHKKILPDIFDPKKSAKFKNKIFSQYECNFLNNLFDKETVQDLKQSIQFTCAI